MLTAAAVRDRSILPTLVPAATAAPAIGDARALDRHVSCVGAVEAVEGVR